MLMAKLIDRNRDLSNLFEFNVRVDTVNQQRYCVDLLWRDGRVVVEIDGYYYHSRPENFRADRHRDYSLLISGYLVLRLPHDEVLADPQLALEKIRDVVKFRRLTFSQSIKGKNDGI